MVDTISGVQARSLFDVLDQLDTQQLGISPPNLLLLGHGPRAVSRLFHAPLEHDDCRPGTGNLQSPFWLSLRRSEGEQDDPAGHGGKKLLTYDDNVSGVPSVDLRHDGLAKVRRVSPYLPNLSFVYLTHGEQDGEEEESSSTKLDSWWKATCMTVVIVADLSMLLESTLVRRLQDHDERGHRTLIVVDSPRATPMAAAQGEEAPVPTIQRRTMYRSTDPPDTPQRNSWQPWTLPVDLSSGDSSHCAKVQSLESFLVQTVARGMSDVKRRVEQEFTPCQALLARLNKSSGTELARTSFLQRLAQEISAGVWTTTRPDHWPTQNVEQLPSLYVIVKARGALFRRQLTDSVEEMSWSHDEGEIEPFEVVDHSDRVKAIYRGCIRRWDTLVRSFVDESWGWGEDILGEIIRRVDQSSTADRIQRQVLKRRLHDLREGMEGFVANTVRFYLAMPSLRDQDSFTQAMKAWKQARLTIDIGEKLSSYFGSDVDNLPPTAIPVKPHDLWRHLKSCPLPDPDADSYVRMYTEVS